MHQEKSSLHPSPLPTEAGSAYTGPGSSQHESLQALQGTGVSQCPTACSAPDKHLHCLSPSRTSNLTLLLHTAQHSNKRGWQRNQSAWSPGAAVKPTPRQLFPRQAGLWLCLFLLRPPWESRLAPRSPNKPSVPQQLRLTKLPADDDKHSGLDGCQAASPSAREPARLSPGNDNGRRHRDLSTDTPSATALPEEAAWDLAPRLGETPKPAQQAFCSEEPVNAWQGLSSNS